MVSIIDSLVLVFLYNQFLIHLYRHQVHLVLLLLQEQLHVHQWLLLLLARFLLYEFLHPTADNFSVSKLVLLPFYRPFHLYAEKRIFIEEM